MRSAILWLVALVFLAMSAPAAAEEDLAATAFDPFELKPLDGLSFIEMVRFEFSIGSIAKKSEPPDIQIILRRTGQSEMSVEGPFVRERIEADQTVLESNIPEFDDDWEVRHTEEWMRLSDGRIRLFNSGGRIDDRGASEDGAADQEKTLSMMANMIGDIDLVVQLLTTPVLGAVRDDGGRPFPVDTQQARIRIADWISPAIKFGVDRHGDTAMMRELALDTIMFGAWLRWEFDLSYRGKVHRDGADYLRFVGSFGASFAMPDTDMLLSVASLHPMELLIDPISGHEKYRLLDVGVAMSVDGFFMKVRNLRERKWTLPNSTAE